MERCTWCGTDELYTAYHDKEWGTPVYDDKVMFEFLILETFQAGLSWITILRKRENFRKAFDNFNPEVIALYDDNKTLSLLEDSGIIRNRLKISATISNAQAYLKLKDEMSLCDYFWSFVDHKPVVNEWENLKDIPSKTALSDAICKDMKKRGFKFVGSTVIYAHLQATGIINDHTKNCFRWRQVQKHYH